jgi:hypothetical protein
MIGAVASDITGKFKIPNKLEDSLVKYIENQDPEAYNELKKGLDKNTLIKIDELALNIDNLKFEKKILNQTKN